MNNFGVVLRYTYLHHLKQRTFRISAVISLLLITLIFQVPTLMDAFNGESNELKQVGILNVDERLKLTLEQVQATSDEQTFQWVVIENEQEAKELLKQDQLAGYVMATDQVNPNGVPDFQYKSLDAFDQIVPQLSTLLQAVNLQYAMEIEGITAEQASRLLAPVALDTVQLNNEVNGEKTESQMLTSFWLVYAMLLVLYFSVVTTGSLVATEVTVEKSSRVMEILISSVSPMAQMFGKIVAICLLGLTQLGLMLGMTIVNVALAPANEWTALIQSYLGSVGIELFIYMLIFYLLGYLIYATIFAAVGSLVSRAEEVQQAITPAMLFIVAAFLLAMFGIGSPNAAWVTVLSYVPFFSPFLMFLRIGVSNPAWWEIALSLGILIISIFILVWIAAKIYRVGVLMYGKKPSMREVYRAIQMMNTK
jgi:ABC-2 type transport system permease protein